MPKLFLNLWRRFSGERKRNECTLSITVYHIFLLLLKWQQRTQYVSVLAMSFLTVFLCTGLNILNNRISHTTSRIHVLYYIPMLFHNVTYPCISKEVIIYFGCGKADIIITEFAWNLPQTFTPGLKFVPNMKFTTNMNFTAKIKFIPNMKFTTNMEFT